jgi:hypothetical protein
MIRARGLLLAALVAAPLGAQPCRRATPAGTTHFYIESVATAPRDSVVVARLCLSSVAAVGSYMAVVAYDSSAARVTGVQTMGGMGAANPEVPGVVRIAAAAPKGFANGVLATISFRRSAAMTLSRIGLRVSEATTISGAALSPRSTGWRNAAVAPLGRPVIDSIRPTSGVITHERIVDVVLYGRGFAGEGNAVEFGRAEVSGLASERGGTVIRFSAPSEIPARGSRPARRVAPGRIEVRVKHAGGTSNAVVFTARGGA